MMATQIQTTKIMETANRRLNQLAATIGTPSSIVLESYPTAAPSKSDDDVVIVS